MNDEAVAYSFSLPPGEADGDWYGGEYLGGFSANALGVNNDGSGRERVVTMFTSGELCRAVLREEPSTVPVIVCNGKGLVTPVNLAAALCMDTPDRDVYLIDDHPTRSLAGRARAAGIRGILDSSQAQRLLALDCVPAIRAHSAEETRRVPVRSRSLPFLVAPVEESVLSQGVSHAQAFRPQAPHTQTSRPQAPLAQMPHTQTSHTQAETLPVPSVVPERPAGQGRVIGFFSGRGGVGKSTVSLMAAFLAQKRGLRVALVDLDMQFGDMGFLAGREASSRIQRLPLAQLCASSCLPPLDTEALTLILAPDHPEQAEQLATAVPQLLGELAAQRDLVVINTGSFWADIHAKAIQCCDHLVLLTDQRATSIEACKQVVDLCFRLQVPQARLLFLLNGCGRHAALTPQDVGLALGGVEVSGLADGGTLVDELLALGCPLELLESGNAFVNSLDRFLDTLTGNRSVPGLPNSAAQGTGRMAGPGFGPGAKIFDFATLRGIFKGVHGVAS